MSFEKLLALIEAKYQQPASTFRSSSKRSLPDRFGKESRKSHKFTQKHISEQPLNMNSSSIPIEQSPQIVEIISDSEVTSSDPPKDTTRTNLYQDNNEEVDDDIVFIESIAVQSKPDVPKQKQKKILPSPDIIFVGQKSISQPHTNRSAPQTLSLDSPFGTCYGMIESPLTNINIANASESKTLKYSPFSQVFIRVKPSSSKPFTVLEFYQDPAFPLAELNDALCRDLSSLLGMLRFECRICIWSPYPIARLILYGSRQNALYIGAMLKNYPLRQPDIQPSKTYFNPQTIYTASSLNPLLSGVQTGGTFNPEHNRLQRYFKSLASTDELETSEPDSRLSARLYKYQKQGLRWMINRELGQGGDIWQEEGQSWRNVITGTIETKRPNFCYGGILADDMGLGKTIQIISLILTSVPKAFASDESSSSKSKKPSIPPQQTWGLISTKTYDFGFIPSDIEKKAQVEGDDSSEENPLLGSLPSKSTLIVCPLSTIHNWEDQILTHTSAGSLKVLVFHGQARTADAKLIGSYDVVITTYNILASGFTKNSSNCSPLHKIYWHRIVLDEAHIIKSQATLQARAAYDLKSKIRWCLSGTPLQNKLDDLYSLIRFLRVEPLNKKSEWMFHISKPISNSKNNEVAFSKLQLLMKVLTLRRTKADIVDGKPLIQLPPRSEEIRLLQLDSVERKIYDEVHRRGKMFFDRLKAGGLDVVMKNYIQILTAILMMRQACLHPSMVKLDGPPITALDDDEDDLRALDTPLPLDQSRRALKLLRQMGEDNCIFCGSGLEGPGNFMIPCKHLVCSSCIQTLLDVESSSLKKVSCSKSTLSSKQVDCPLCRIPLSLRNISKITELDLERVEDEGDNKHFTKIISDGKTATKIRALIDDLRMVKKQDPTVKSVVFSQFTTMLDLCQAPLRNAGFHYVRLDGGMSRTSRSEAEKDFKSKKNVTVFLISIKAGGVGLNLTTANRVYMMEPYWNPAVEQQAIDRVHRLGQTRPVATIRFIIDNSIEQNMQKRQIYKTALAEKALDEDDLCQEDDPSNQSSSLASRKRKRGASGRDEILKEKMESLNILFRIDDRKAASSSNP